MHLNPNHLPVPDVLVTPLFTLRRQRLEDNVLDYKAVMDSREELRVWSDSEWPEDSFTPENNLEDLHMHIGEHNRNEAYGFSIFMPDEQRLLGSLYFSAVVPFQESYHVSAADEAILARADVRMDYWLRQGTAPEFHQDFLKSVFLWLFEAWWFEGVVYGSRREAHSQRAAYEAAGLREAVRLTSKDGTRRFHFHG
jgi:hypothetical protein